MRKIPHGRDALAWRPSHLRATHCWRTVVGAAVAILAFASIVGFGQTALSSAAALAQDAGVGYWLGVDQAAIRLDPSTGVVTRTISLTESPLAVATRHADNSVDVLAPPRLYRFAPDGAALLTLDLRTLATGLGDARLMQPDAYDGSLWVANAGMVVRVGKDGNVIADWTSTSAIVSIAVDVDGSLWVLTQDALVHLSSSAGQLTLSPLSGVLSQPRYLALDSLGKRVLVADASQVLKFDPANLSAPPEVAGTSADNVADGGSAPEIVGIAAHPLFGTLWVATAKSLRIFDRSGSLLKTIDLGPYKIGPITALAFDFDDGSLWLGASQAVGRFRSNGDFVARLPLPARLTTLGTPSFALTPHLSLVSPADGASVNGAGLTLKYGLGGDCNGVLCFPDGDYADALNLDVQLNGHPVGPPYRSTPFEASFAAGVFAQSGMNRVTAQATDRFGHVSSTVQSQFRVGAPMRQFRPGSSPSAGSGSPTLPSVIGGGTTVPPGNVAGGTTIPSAATTSPGVGLSTTTTTGASARTAAVELGQLPLSFEKNLGQTDQAVKFIARRGGQTMFFTSSGETVLVLSKTNSKAKSKPLNAPLSKADLVAFSRDPVRFWEHRRADAFKLAKEADSAGISMQTAVIRARLVGAQISPQTHGVDPVPGKHNYLIGKDASKWVRNVPSYARIQYNNVYPGIDQNFYGHNNQLEYDLVVQPGADPSRIRIAFDGVKSVRLNKQGDIALETLVGTLT
jgi:hypothetical protein